KGWRALEGGLKRVYAQGRDALEASAADATTENLHEWRKQGKYLWHQLQLLEPVWPETMKELADQSHHLTQLLGANHDRAAPPDRGPAAPDSFGGDSPLETLLALIARRRDELQAEAFSLGQRLYTDRPKEFVRRIHGYWKEWRARPEATP